MMLYGFFRFGHIMMWLITYHQKMFQMSMCCEERIDKQKINLVFLFLKFLLKFQSLSLQKTAIQLPNKL